MTYWGAFYNLWPFGSERDNIHAGIIASTYFNTMRGKNQQPLNPSDLMLVPPELKRQQETNEFVAFLGAHAVKKDT